MLLIQYSQMNVKLQADVDVSDNGYTNKELNCIYVGLSVHATDRETGWLMLMLRRNVARKQ